MNDGKVEGCREIIEVTACFNKSYIEFRKCINEDNKEENKEMRIEYGALYMKEAPSWCDYTMGNYLGIGLALLVFGVYCIWNDAYMNLNQKPWSVHLMFGVLALCNLGIAENNQRIGTLFVDGKLGFGAVNLVFAVMFIVFEIVFFIKRSLEKRDLSEEKAE